MVCSFSRRRAYKVNTPFPSPVANQALGGSSSAQPLSLAQPSASPAADPQGKKRKLDDSSHADPATAAPDNTSQPTSRGQNLLQEQFGGSQLQRAQTTRAPPYVKFPKALVSDPYSAQVRFPVIPCFFLKKETTLYAGFAASLELYTLLLLPDKSGLGRTNTIIRYTESYVGTSSSASSLQQLHWVRTYNAREQSLNLVSQNVDEYVEQMTNTSTALNDCVASLVSCSQMNVAL